MLVVFVVLPRDVNILALCERMSEIRMQAAAAHVRKEGKDHRLLLLVALLCISVLHMGAVKV